MLALQFLIGFITFIYILKLYFTRTFNYWNSRNVPGPQPTILFGNLKRSTLRKEPFAVATKNIYDEFPNEPVVGMYRMTNPCLLIRDLDVIKHIMIKDFDVFEDRGVEFSKEGLGANLFHADGDTWRVLRNRFTPIFTSGKLKNMLHLITEKGHKFLDFVEITTNNQPEQEIHTLVQMYTVTTIAACAFGLDIDATAADDNTYLQSLSKIDKMIFSRHLVHELDMMYPGLLKKINVSVFPKELIKFFEDLVKTVVRDRSGKPTNRNDFMDLILALRNQKDISGPKKMVNSKDLSLEITDDVIAGQAFVFYAAGYETSATTMAFMLYELAMNPHIQDKLIEEVDAILEKYNGNITYEMLSELPYMEKVFDESLRKYPLVDPLQRRAKYDYKIPGTNVTIKKGQTILVSVLGLHYDEKLYPKPEIFDPERFSMDESAKRHSCAYLPFGVGPRNCIGMRFAKVQSRVCILNLLSRFRVEPSENMKEMSFDSNRLIIGPEKGYRLKFIARRDKKPTSIKN